MTVFPYILDSLSSTKKQQKCIIGIYLPALHELCSVSTSSNHLWKPCGSLFVKMFSYWQSRTGGVTDGSHTLFHFEASFLLHKSFLKPCVHSVQASGWPRPGYWKLHCHWWSSQATHNLCAPWSELAKSLSSYMWNHSELISEEAIMPFFIFSTLLGH